MTRERRAELELQRGVAAGLPMVAFGLAALQAIFTPAHLLLLPPGVGAVMASVSGTVALVCAALGLVWRRRTVAPARASAAFSCLAGLALGTSALHLWLLPDPANTANFAGVAVGIGLFQLDRRWLAGSLLLVWLTWLGVVLGSPPSQLWGHYAFGLLMATALAVAAHAARRRHLLGLTAALSAAVRSEARFRTLAASAPDAIVTIDVDSRVRFANDAVAEILGWRPDELEGEPLATLIPEPLRDAHAAGLRRYLATGERSMAWRNVRLDAVHREGHTVPVEVSFSEWDDGGERRFIGFIRDVTAREAAETERRALERRVQDTQRLESLGLLAGGIAHDFNNLLTPIIAHASLLAEGPEADAEAAAEIRDAARTAASLTQQLLAYAGRAPDRRVPVDLSAQVSDLARLAGSSLPGGVGLELASGLPAVEADPGQLQQVVLNLLSNAADACAGRGSVQVRTFETELDAERAGRLLPESERPAGRYVALEVRDDGVGMDASVQRRIFDPFFTTKGPNRGLGLAAVLGIARRMGAGLEVESRPGEGATLRLLAPASSRPHQRGVETRSDFHGKGRVLLVDDERGIRRAVGRMLRSLGFDVEAVESGERALEVLDEVAPVLVVLDLSMPGIGGPETLRRLRERRPELPVLLSSGYDASDDRATGHGESGVGFLQKPYDVEDLAVAAQQLLEPAAGA